MAKKKSVKKDEELKNSPPEQQTSTTAPSPVAPPPPPDPGEEPEEFDEEELEETLSDTSPDGGKDVFVIKNVSRARHNKTLRAQNPVHYRQKHHIGGEHRLRRGRPLTLTKNQLEKHIVELRQKEAAGVLEVFTLDGRRVYLNKMAIEPMRMPPPLPHPLQDSAARDIPAGQPMPMAPGGVPLTELGPALDTTLSTGIPGPLGMTGPMSGVEPPSPPPVSHDQSERLAEAQRAAAVGDQEHYDYDGNEPTEEEAK